MHARRCFSFLNRVENYRVKLTEITLIPNQKPPEVDNPPLDSPHIDMSPPENDIEKDASFHDSKESEIEANDWGVLLLVAK